MLIIENDVDYIAVRSNEFHASCRSRDKTNL